jgi:NADH-quinone oxidoreductase subunit G
MFAHVLRGTVKRVVPKANEDINETWLADRDRFSYEGIYSADRLNAPRIKKDGEWADISWESALQTLADQLKASKVGNVGILASPSSTVEESHLLSRLAEQIGTSNIDHRLRRRDFSDQDNDPLVPWLGCNIADIEDADAILLAGSNVRQEAPIIGHRVRKAALGGAKVCFADDQVHEYHFDVAAYAANAGLVETLAGIAKATGQPLPTSIKDICAGVESNSEHKRIASILAESDNGIVLLGLAADRHNASAAVRALAACIAEMTGSSFGTLSEGSNSAGAHLAGILPHREQGGRTRTTPGYNAREMLDASLDTMILFGAEPDEDFAADAVEQLSKQKFVAAMTPYHSDALAQVADLMLPVGTFAETSGTYVNCEGRWQSFAGVANPVGEARPGWKVLRVLGNLLELDNCDYTSSDELRDELQLQLNETQPDNSYRGQKALAKPNGADTPGSQQDIAMYQVDALVRRAAALQLTPEGLRHHGKRKGA